MFLLFMGGGYKRDGYLINVNQLIKMEAWSKTQLELFDWINEQLRYGNVPRLADVQMYVKRQAIKLSKNQVTEVLRLHPQYRMNMQQQRMPGRSRMYRPVVVSELGHWHADIGFFAITSKYETPISYRSGYLVAKDILSRQIYATPLIKNKSADSLIRAFTKLFEMHAAQHPNTPVRSIAFDQEAAVTSKKVQAFFAEKNIKFHAFKLSSSKAKFAEGAIRQIREVMARLLQRGLPKDRWWNLLPVVVDNLNNQEIIVDKKRMGFTPNQVTEETVALYKRRLHKAVPAYYFAQFDIAPDLVSFKYEVNDRVRAKLIATSSDVVGNKRSEQNVTDQVFVIEQKVPYVTRKMTIGKSYKVRSLATDEVEIFQEDELALTSV
jgi:hypothetical protein